MNLTGHNPITANGTYIATGIKPGRSYLCTLYGTWGGGTVTFSHIDSLDGVTARNPVDNTFTGNSEFTFIVPSSDVVFTLTGATSPSITVSIVSIQ